MEPRRKKGNDLLEEVKGTYRDPLRYKNWSESDERARLYLADSNIQIHYDINDLYGFFDSYINSDGYRRIMDNLWKEYKKQHPILSLFSSKTAYTSSPEWYDSGKGLRYYMDLDMKRNALHGPNIYQLDGYPEMSFDAAPGTFIYKNPNWQDPKYPDAFVLGHEFAHRFPSWYQFNSDALLKNTNTNPGHDSRVDEKYSDVWGLKYLLYKEGIYDSRGKEDAKPSHIKLLRKKYPKLRPLKQMNDEKAAWMLNNVTSIQNRRMLLPKQLET